MNFSSAAGFRRPLAGLALIVGPALILVAAILDPAGGEKGEQPEYLRAIVDDPDRAELSTALWMYGFLVTALGIVGLVHVIRGRGVTLANIGGVLAVVGMILFLPVFASTLDDLNNAQTLGVEDADRLSDNLEDDYWLPYAVFIPAAFGTFVGFILLAIALIRSRFTHIAAAVLIFLGIVGIVFLSEDSKVGAIAANALLLAGWGMVGLRILGLKDEQWDAGAPPPAAPPPNV